MNDVEITMDAQKRIAKAGLDVLGRPETLTPGHLKRDIMLLEALLTGIAAGQLIVGTPPGTVEST